jgi:nifR3 family TIM-barrel protein
VSRGRGAALLREPDKVSELVASLVGAANCPVTAKIRLGWDDDSLNYLEIARRIEDAGAAAVGVHGRTRAQGYGGQANWEAIAEVRAALDIPVLANGDVRDTNDIARIKAVTGCDLVLIGRGAVGNPWIFGRRDLCDVSPLERVAMMRRHLSAMVAHYGEARGVILFRKHALKYTRGLPHSAALRGRIVSTKTLRDTFSLLESWDLE